MEIKSSSQPIKIAPLIPWAALIIIGLMAVMFRVEENAYRWGVIDDIVRDFSFSWDLFHADPWHQFPRLISYLFLHADRTHLVWNMVFLFIFALPVENFLGWEFFMVCFFITGAVAAVIQGLLTQSGGIGASGGIFGLAGAFFVLLPLHDSASVGQRAIGVIVLGVWFLSQIHLGFLSLLPTSMVPNLPPIAFWAHAAGFAVGALSVLPWLI